MPTHGSRAIHAGPQAGLPGGGLGQSRKAHMGIGGHAEELAGNGIAGLLAGKMAKQMLCVDMKGIMIFLAAQADSVDK